MKTWVLILKNNGKVVAWRDYGDVAWGAATYAVLGYYDGSYKNALAYAKTLKPTKGVA